MYYYLGTDYTDTKADEEDAQNEATYQCYKSKIETKSEDTNPLITRANELVEKWLSVKNCLHEFDKPARQIVYPFIADSFYLLCEMRNEVFDNPDKETTEFKNAYIQLYEAHRDAKFNPYGSSRYE